MTKSTTVTLNTTFYYFYMFSTSHRLYYVPILINIHSLMLQHYYIFMFYLHIALNNFVIFLNMAKYVIALTSITNTIGISEGRVDMTLTNN